MANDPNPVEIKLTSSADAGGIDKTVDGLKETTDATKELSAAEAAREQRKAEFEQRRADTRANGTNVASFEGEGPNPFTDGSQLRQVEAVTEAVKEQSKSWEELSEVQESAEVIAQRLADVEEARRIGRERDIENARKEAEEAVKERDAAQANFAAKAAGIGLVATAWATLTGEVKNQIAALKEVSPEAAKQFAALEIGLEALQNPFRAAILPTIRETEEEMDLLRQAIDNAAQAEARYQAAASARAKEIETAAKNRIQGTLTQELNIIEDQNRAYERRLRLLDSEREKLEVLAKFNDLQRIANGEDPATVNAQAAGRQAAFEQSQLNEKAAKAQFDLDQANATIQSLTEAIAGAASPAQRDELEEKREQVIRTSEELKEELATVLQEKADQEAIANAELQDKIRQASEQKQREAAEFANETISTIEGSGKELADINKKGIDILKTITADGRITQDEMRAYFEGIQKAQAGLLLNAQTQGEINAQHNAAIEALNQVTKGLLSSAEKGRVQAETLRQQR